VPNACNKCPTDKDTDWALSATEKWWGDKMKRPSRERAQTVAAARAGTLTSGVPLLTLLLNEPNGYWKASLIRLLGAWSADAEVARAFLEYAQHPDPLVRTAAVQALESIGGPLGDAAQKVLARRTEDNERAVRVAAVSALRAVPDATSRAFRELMHALDLAADQPMGQLQKGAWAQANGDTAGALAHFEKAVAWDPNSGGIRNEFARLLSGMGRAEDTLVQMQEAVRLAGLLLEQPATRGPEVHALLALLLLQGARLPARLDTMGEVLTLAEQDRGRWDPDWLRCGFWHLRAAMGGERLTAWHVEAGIASVHAAASDYASTDWRQVLGWYDRLVQVADAPLVRLNRAIAVAKLQGAAAGLRELADPGLATALDGYQLWWAVRAQLAWTVGELGDAAVALQRALACGGTEPEQRLLARRLAAVQRGESAPVW
jgi:tetratricopeptide (TPR) repeat protein